MEIDPQSAVDVLWAQILTPPCSAGIVLGDPVDLLKQKILDQCVGAYAWEEWIDTVNKVYYSSHQSVPKYIDLVTLAYYRELRRLLMSELVKRLPS